MIYFVECEGMVKIGYSTNPRKRISALQTSNPLDLTMLLVIEGGKSDEIAFHERFRNDRYRGEWFHLSEDIRSYILSIQKSNIDLRYELGLMEPNDTYGELTRLRNNHSMPLRVVGELLGITAQSVKEMEDRERAGTVTLNCLKKYGKALGYTFAYKFTYDPEGAEQQELYK